MLPIQQSSDKPRENSKLHKKKRQKMVDRMEQPSNPTLDHRSKDKKELMLESLVFGEEPYLMEQVDHIMEDDESEIEGFDRDYGGQDEEGEENFNRLSDSLFFLDPGPLTAGSSLSAEDHENKAVDLDQSSSDEELNVKNTGLELAATSTVNMYGYHRAPAWEDTDDPNLRVSLVAEKRLRKLRKNEDEDTVNGIEYEQRLRHQFERLHPRPGWATLPSSKNQRNDASKKKKRLIDNIATSDSEYSDEERQYSESEADGSITLLRSTHGILERKRMNQALPGDILDITRMKNANQTSYSQSIVSSVGFHPSGQVLLTSGLDKTLRLFQIDGKINSKIQSIHFKDMPIWKSAFDPSGNTIISTGRRKYFYIYDIQSGTIAKSPGIMGRSDYDKSLEKFSISPCGKYIAFLGRDGYIVLVSFLTKQWIANLKMSGSVRSVDWSLDGKYLWSIGGESKVYQWDLRTTRCLRRWDDDGGFKASVLAVAENERYFAIGSRSGIVNIYDSSAAILPDKDKIVPPPRPFKSLYNLTTSVYDIKFNCDAQILGMFSRAKKDQFKLVHLPSATVFSNWPTSSTPLSYVQCFDFSPNSGYVAIGNDRGKVLLYRLNHYGSA